MAHIVVAYIEIAYSLTANIPIAQVVKPYTTLEHVGKDDVAMAYIVIALIVVSLIVL